MNIEFNGNYKSLKSFKVQQLPKLTIITGKNGSGKSQFIELFDHMKLPSDCNIQLHPDFKYNDIQIEGLRVERTMQHGRRNWHDAWHQLGNSLNIHNAFKELLDQLVKRGIPIAGLNSKDLLLVYEEPTMSEKRMTEIYKTIHLISEDTKVAWESVSEYILTEIARREKTITAHIEISKFHGKPLNDISVDDIYFSPVDEKLLSNSHLFRSEISEIFYFYYKRRYDNLLQKFFRQELGISNNAVSDADFVSVNPRPEDEFNAILAQYNLPYYVKSPKLEWFPRVENYSFPLFKIGTDTLIYFEDLSTGEKVIIGLITKVFFSNYFDDKLELPKVLLLDEPDSSLHPEMSKLLIDIIKEVFVERHGMYVVMTTHSPTTVALSSEENIYQMFNDPITQLLKISRDEALALLTEELPTLSIDYKNHKQVFVEGETDLHYYQAIANILQTDKKMGNRLYFIANSKGRGNVDHVKKIVSELRRSGNTSVWGIIDWDIKNENEDCVLVHGKGNRYTLENFLCDPIYLVALFVRQKGANRVLSELNLDKYYREQNIGDEPTNRLQFFANWVIDKIEAYLKLNVEKEVKEVKYLNGKSLIYPKWFLDYNGHDLIELLKKVFDSLRNLDERKIEEELIAIAVRCYPFISVDTVDLLQEIANSKNSYN